MKHTLSLRQNYCKQNMLGGVILISSVLTKTEIIFFKKPHLKEREAKNSEI